MYLYSILLKLKFYVCTRYLEWTELELERWTLKLSNDASKNSQTRKSVIIHSLLLTTTMPPRRAPSQGSVAPSRPASPDVDFDDVIVFLLLESLLTNTKSPAFDTVDELQQHVGLLEAFTFDTASNGFRVSTCKIFWSSKSVFFLLSCFLVFINASYRIVCSNQYSFRSKHDDATTIAQDQGSWLWTAYMRWFLRDCSAGNVGGQGWKDQGVPRRSSLSNASTYCVT